MVLSLPCAVSGTSVRVLQSRLCAEAAILDESGSGTLLLADTIHALLERAGQPSHSLV